MRQQMRRECYEDVKLESNHADKNVGSLLSFINIRQVTSPTAI